MIKFQPCSNCCSYCDVQEELQDLREDLCEALIALRLNNRMMILKVLSKHIRHIEPKDIN